jgi:glycosyltransferase involved in cell wall biosynthesis
LLNEDDESTIRAIPNPERDQVSDIGYRISFPFNFSPGNSRKTFIFGTSEYQIVTDAMITGDMLAATRDYGHRIITPSNWSKTGFINYGVAPDSINVIPHGVDSNIFWPLPENSRNEMRKNQSMEDNFIFLHVGLMSENKGVDVILKAFNIILKQYPHVKLLLKGHDSIYSSMERLDSALTLLRLNPSEIENILARILYIGSTISFVEMAGLYQIADAYLSPYNAEGFNVPVLEAMACGLPVICTKGGPTDDFINKEVALPVESKKLCKQGRYYFEPDLDHLVERMKFVIENHSFRNQARTIGPGYVKSNYSWSNIVDQMLEVFGIA